MSNPKIKYHLYTGSKFQTEHSIVGPNFVNGNPTPIYSSGYYKDSLSQYFPHTPTINELVSVSNVFPEEGCFEFWAKFDASYTGTSWSDATSRCSIGGGDFPYIRMVWNHGLGILYDINFHSVNSRMTVTTIAPNSGEWHHYALNWSTINNTQELYYDGVLKGNTSTIMDKATGTKDFLIGGYQQTTPYLGAGGNIDGFISWTYQKKDFTDRFKRRRGLNDKVE